VTVNPLPTGTFRVEIDADHGGRWTSLIDRAGREWLWSQPCPARSQVRPGNAFVDAGGVEECFPTVTGVPDHGDVWTRAWAADGGGMTVKTGAFTLHRRLSVGTDITVDYRLTGPPGAAFVWAFHALLRPDVGSRIVADATLSRIWAEDGQPVDDHWPVIAGRPGGDVLGPDDGSAVFCVLPQLQHGVSVQQGTRGCGCGWTATRPRCPSGSGGTSVVFPHRGCGTAPSGSSRRWAAHRQCSRDVG